MNKKSFHEAAEDLHRACAEFGWIVATHLWLVEIVEWLNAQCIRLAQRFEQ